MSVLPLSFLFIFIHQTFSIENDYYWREYTGSPPLDAVAAGTDINNKNVYIGQAYVKDAGLVVVQLTPGVKEAFATIGGITKIDKYIKILCGSQLNFHWMPANATNLHLLTINKHPVVGGHEDAFGQMNIGRIAFEGEVRVGKINAFWPGFSSFYFHSNGKEVKVDSYEVLMYQTLNLDLRTL